MFCMFFALLGHDGERLQDHWSSGCSLVFRTPDLEKNPTIWHVHPATTAMKLDYKKKKQQKTTRSDNNNNKKPCQLDILLT